MLQGPLGFCVTRKDPLRWSKDLPRMVPDRKQLSRGILGPADLHPQTISWKITAEFYSQECLVGTAQ